MCVLILTSDVAASSEVLMGLICLVIYYEVGDHSCLLLYMGLPVMVHN